MFWHSDMSYGRFHSKKLSVAHVDSMVLLYNHLFISIEKKNPHAFNKFNMWQIELAC